MMKMCGRKECLDEVMRSLPKDGNSESSNEFGGEGRTTVVSRELQARRRSDVAAERTFAALTGPHCTAATG